MVTFEVRDMTCGHCVSTISKAVLAVDRGAKLSVDLATHRVRIEPTESDATELGDAIRAAGYTPVQITGEALPMEPTAPRSGCCCR